MMQNMRSIILAIFSYYIFKINIIYLKCDKFFYVIDGMFETVFAVLFTFILWRHPQE